MRPVHAVDLQWCSWSSHRGVHSVVCRLLCSYVRPGHRRPPQWQHHGPQHRTGGINITLLLQPPSDLSCLLIRFCFLLAFSYRLRPHPGKLQVQVWHQEGACPLYPHTRLYSRHPAGQDGKHGKIWQVCSFKVCFSTSLKILTLHELEVSVQ